MVLFVEYGHVNTVNTLGCLFTFPMEITSELLQCMPVSKFSIIRQPILTGLLVDI